MAQTILEEKKKSRLMTEGSIWKSILLFSVPLILGNMLQQLYNTADSIIVGNFVGSNALAAVGSSGSPIFLLIGFSQGIAVGAGVVVSQFLGAKDREGAHTAVHTSLALSAILGAILTVCGIAVSRALLTAMNTPAEVLEDAVLYMRLYFGGVLFSVVYNMTAGILNAAGNSKRSLLYLGVASITNIVLDLVLIAGCKMGVAGAAIATDISQLVSCVLSLRFLMRVEDDYRVMAKEVRVHKKMAVRIIKVGLPTGIQNMVISLSNVLVQVSVNGYGAAAMAGFAAYMKVDGFNILPVLSFSMAATTFVGQNFGAGKIDRVKKGTFVTLGMCIVYTILTGILLLAFQDPIMHLFTGDETVIAYGKICMLYFCPFYWMLGILQGLAGTVRGTGKSVPPMVVLLISLCLFRIVWIQFALPLFAGMTIALACYVILPTGLDLRPYRVYGSDIFAQAVRMLYATDTPLNVCPSIHVFNSVTLMMAYYRSRIFETPGRRWMRPASAVLCVSIIASTVLLKQHSCIDVLLGILLAMVLDTAMTALERSDARALQRL